MMILKLAQPFFLSKAILKKKTDFSTFERFGDFYFKVPTQGHSIIIPKC
jgi:hypothetical protein